MPFDQKEISQRGHAIECRIYAEDPANNFLPDIGLVLKAIEPTGPGVRVDSGITTGDEITVHYDPMIAKLIVGGENRAEALKRMAWALKQYIILGVTTNIPFLRDVITHEAFQQGETTTNFIEQYFAGWQPTLAVPDIALVAAALSEIVEKPQASKQGYHTTKRGDPYSPWEQLSGFRVGQKI